VIGFAEEVMDSTLSKDRRSGEAKFLQLFQGRGRGIIKRAGKNE